MEVKCVAQVLRVQRRACIAANGRQLGRIANHQKLAVVAAVNIFKEAFKHAVEEAFRIGAGAYHRGLVNDEQCVAVKVLGQAELYAPRSVAAFAEDLFMDSECRTLCVPAEYLGGAARGGKQHAPPPYRGQGFRDSGYKVGL